ncbi:Uma2 family endonuclease [Herbihabitans rhizosphaerae]|nr:Uma2 family endonuclease [Herbihabitans rhizosphaerae]
MPEAPAFPHHPREWTLEEVLALPEDNGQRIELIDGALVVSPAPTSRHQEVLQNVQFSLRDVIPPGHRSLPGINILLAPRRLLIPDLTVTAEQGNFLYGTSDNVLLAVEVLSPLTGAYDKALKRQLYAEAAIGYFLLIDPVPEPPTATLFELDGEEYTEIAHSEDGLLRIELPFPVEIDLG